MNRVIRKIENFLQTDSGQRLLQYGYSFGAAIVILGAMVKVLHLWGVWGNIIFGTGMAVEVIVFILYGLDRPPKSYDWENVFPSLESGNPEDRPNFGSGQYVAPQGGGSINYGSQAQSTSGISHNFTPQQQQSSQSQGTSHNVPSGDYVGQLDSVSQNVAQFTKAVDTLTAVSESLQESYKHIIDNSHNISANSLGYVQQMEALNRNISGLNTIYEIQLKGISSQIETIENINKGLSNIKEMYSGSLPDSTSFKDETEKMTRQIQELNQIYGRMIQAMTASNNPTIQ